MLRNFVFWSLTLYQSRQASLEIYKLFSQNLSHYLHGYYRENAEKHMEVVLHE